MKKTDFTYAIFIAVLFCINNLTVKAETATFETVTDALNYDGDKAAVTKLVITGQISGNDYSDESEWSKFCTLDETFPNIEAVEILTDQDIPDYIWFHTGGNAILRGLFFYEIDSWDNLKAATWLKSFSAPSVKTIGSWAFNGCKNLTTINFPAVTTIKEWAFDGCENLASIDFPVAQTIGNKAFNGCENLTTANFLLLTTIRDSIFWNCANLTTINFPAAQTIGNGAFNGCENLTTINFPNVVTIRNDAFTKCANLTSIDFPLATMIGNYAFGGCENLTSVRFGTEFTEPTEIEFGNFVFGFNSVLTQNVDLILGEYVLHEPDLAANAWQSTTGTNTGTNTASYIWKSILIYNNIEEIIKNRTVSIFPNPTVADFTVSFDLEKSCNMQILLCDILGKEVMEIYDGFATAGTFSKTFSTENLSRGVYFLKILSGKNFTVEKIVVN